MHQMHAPHTTRTCTDGHVIADAITDDDLRRLVAASIAGGAYFGVGTVLAGSLGLDMSPVVAGLSVTGLSAGFAARDILG